MPEKLSINSSFRKDIFRVFKGASIYGGGKLLKKLLSFFLLPLYTYFLSPTDYGILATINIIGSILLIICIFSFDGAFARYYYDFKNDPELLKKYLGSTITFLLLFNLLFILLLIIFENFIFIPFLPQGEINFNPYIFVQLIIVYFSFISSFVLTTYQVEEKPKKFIIFDAVSLILSVGLVIYFVAVKKMGAYGSLIGTAIASIIIFIISLYVMWDKFYFNLNLSFIKDNLKYGIPITMHLLFSWLLGYADRIILLKYISLEKLGLFYFALQIGLVMYFVVEAINQAWVPFFFDTMKNKENASELISKIIHYYYVIIFSIALIGILFNKEILSLLTNIRYKDAFIYIPYLILNYLIAGFYFMNINTLYYLKKTNYIPIITLSAACIKIILAFILIPYGGIWGAIFSTILATIFWSTTVYIIANRLYYIKYQFNPLIKLFSVFIIFFTVDILFSFQSLFVSILIKFAMLTIFSILLKRMKIIDFSNFIKFFRSFDKSLV